MAPAPPGSHSPGVPAALRTHTVTQVIQPSAEHTHREQSVRHEGCERHQPSGGPELLFLNIDALCLALHLICCCFVFLAHFIAHKPHLSECASGFPSFSCVCCHFPCHVQAFCGGCQSHTQSPPCPGADQQHPPRIHQQGLQGQGHDCTLTQSRTLNAETHTDCCPAKREALLMEFGSSYSTSSSSLSSSSTLSSFTCCVL